MMWVVGQSPTEAALSIAVRRHCGNIPHVREALVGLLSLPSPIVGQMRGSLSLSESASPFQCPGALPLAKRYNEVAPSLKGPL